MFSILNSYKIFLNSFYNWLSISFVKRHQMTVRPKIKSDFFGVLPYKCACEPNSKSRVAPRARTTRFSRAIFVRYAFRRAQRVPLYALLYPGTRFKSKGAYLYFPNTLTFGRLHDFILTSKFKIFAHASGACIINTDAIILCV